MDGINVLSEFDGISCGQLALQRAGIPVANYFASEIDKYAIQVAMKNFPNTIQLGDVRQWRTWDLPKIDLLIAGSPCQGFSIAGKRLNFEDPRSRLFFEFVDTLEDLKKKNPDLYFLLENVNRMHKDVKAEISRILGVEPIMINSALLSAQNRERLYWTNIPGVTQPEDRGLILADILEDGDVDREKSYALDANYWKGGNPDRYFRKGSRQLVFGAAKRNQVTKRGIESQLNVRKDQKSNCVVPSYPQKLNGVVIKTLPHGYIKEREEVSDKYPSLCAQSPRSKHLIRVGTAEDINGHDIIRRVYSPEGVSPTLSAHSGGNMEPKVVTERGLIFIAGLENGRRLDDGKSFSRNYREGSRIYSVKGKSASLSAQPKGGKGGHTGLYGLDKSHYRKLTPVECERLQTLPTVRKYVRMNLCLGHLKSFVSAVKRSPKLLKLVGSAENERLQENVRGAVKSILVSQVSTSIIAQGHVGTPTQLLIKKCTTHKEEESSSDVDIVEKRTAFLGQKRQGKNGNIDSVIVNVGIHLVEGRIVQIGKEEYLLFEQSCRKQTNGESVLDLSGKEMMQLVKDAEKGFLIRRGNNTTFTTSSHLSIKNIEQMLTILYYFAVNVIDGFIHEEIGIKSTSLLLILDDGYTEGISNSQRYKAIGNGWTVDVIAHIFSFLPKHFFTT